MRVCVVALGNPSAGDDGFGPAVLARLRGTVAADVELLRARDVASLAGCVAGGGRVIVVDAALGLGPAGTVEVLSPSDLDDASVALGLSAHDLDVGRALRLGRLLAAEGDAAQVRIVAVAAGAERGPSLELSPAVAAAVAPAAALVRRLVSGASAR